MWPFHKHRWKIYYQSSMIPFNHNFEECECGELRDYWIDGAEVGEPFMIRKTEKRVMIELKEKVKSWN